MNAIGFWIELLDRLARRGDEVAAADPDFSHRFREVIDLLEGRPSIDARFFHRVLLDAVSTSDVAYSEYRALCERPALEGRKLGARGPTGRPEIDGPISDAERARFREKSKEFLDSLRRRPRKPPERKPTGESGSNANGKGR